MALQLAESASKALSPPITPCSDTPSPRSSSSKHFEETTPSKRKSPFSHRVGETSSPNQSNIPDDLRPSLSKKAKSAPGCIIPARAFNDEAIPIQGLKEKPYTSPCGKAYVRRGNWKNHTHKCKECEAVLQLNQEVEATDENGLPSTRPSTTETTNKGQVEAVEENRGETCGTVLGDEDCGAAHIHAPDSELHQRSNRSAPYITDEKLSTDTEATDLEIVRATTRSGTPLDLEDEIYTEGKPAYFPAELRMDGLQLHDKLRDKLERSLTPKDDGGYVYIFSDPDRPHLHKIGRAKKTTSRLRHIQYTCGLQLQLTEKHEVSYYTRTEGLIHAYLSDLRRPYTCKICGTKHGEWFEINKESAQMHVGKWAAFMENERPYDAESRELQPFLKNLLWLREGVLKCVDTEVLRRSWDQVLLPTLMDRFRYRFGILWEVVWKFYWPVNAMVAWTITFVAIQHPATFILMAASVIGTFVTMAQDVHRLRHTGMVSKRKTVK